MKYRELRPEYVHCVGLAMGEHGKDYGKSWCGRDVYWYTLEPLAKALEHPERGGTIERYDRDEKGEPVTKVRRMEFHEFIFVDADHALTHARIEGRLQICPSCAKAMGEALAKGTYTP